MAYLFFWPSAHFKLYSFIHFKNNLFHCFWIYDCKMRDKYTMLNEISKCLRRTCALNLFTVWQNTRGRALLFRLCNSPSSNKQPVNRFWSQMCLTSSESNYAEASKVTQPQPCLSSEGQTAETGEQCLYFSHSWTSRWELRKQIPPHCKGRQIWDSLI